MQRDTGHLMNEADIGSGEKKSGQRDTEKEISKVHNPKMDKGTAGPNEKKSGDGDKNVSDNAPHRSKTSK